MLRESSEVQGRSATPRPDAGIDRLQAQGCPQTPPTSTLDATGHESPQMMVEDAVCQDDPLKAVSSLHQLAIDITTESLRRAIEDTLDFLLRETGAEAGEVLLAEPEFRELVLTFHLGEAQDAFAQIIRFRPGQGVPGTVWVRRSSLCSAPLPDDTRFLRTAVKEAGFQCYYGVPIPGSSGPMGVLGLAFRTIPDSSRFSSLVSTAATLLGLRISSTFTAWRENGLESAITTILGSRQRKVDPFTTFLRETRQQLGARQVELYFAPQLSLPRFTSLPHRSIPGCSTVGRADFGRCPACTQRRSVMLLGNSSEYPAPCRTAATGTGYWCCVPILIGSQAIGVLRCAQTPEHQAFPLESVALAELAGSALAEALALFVARGSYSESETLVPSTTSSVEAPSITIRCFGSFELTIDGKVIDPTAVPRRRVLQFLKILAIHHDRFVPRDMLIEWLWPEDACASRTTQFYVLVHELRRLLDPAENARRSRTIVRDGERYQLVLHPYVWLDLAEFEKALERGKRAEVAGDLIAAADAYARAVELYRGDLLEEEPYAEWCWSARERLREGCIAALRRLATFWGQDGRWDASIAALRRALELDRLREEVHRELMYALWAAGRRAEAVRQYAECARLLREHLNVEPTLETQQLLEAIRRSPSPS